MMHCKTLYKMDPAERYNEIKIDSIQVSEYYENMTRGYVKYICL
jgi:hypothetical protein